MAMQERTRARTSNDERERAILVGARLPERRDEEIDEQPLEELARLADTAGSRVVARMVQDMPRINPATFIGKGKAEELAVLCEELQADLVIFDHDLAPAQARNLEKITQTTVVDHSQIILDIFARRARTRQARLQVELAQLEYELPRFRRMWTHLSRIEGGIGMRGPGETQLEVDRRRARTRIASLKQALEDIQHRRERETRARREFFTVALVGYTNVGKSTLMNALTGADLFAEDRLFATLDATTRRWDLNDQVGVLLTDTVGFIRNLPHHLIASFHATLEEVREADLLLHVLDASHPRLDEQRQTVVQVLEELGCAEQPTLLVLNKADRLSPDLDGHALAGRYEGILVSAHTGDGLDDLSQAVLEEVQSRQHKVWIDLPSGEGRWIAYVEEHGQVEQREYTDSEARLLVWLRPEDRNRLEKEGFRIRLASQ